MIKNFKLFSSRIISNTKKQNFFVISKTPNYRYIVDKNIDYKLDDKYLNYICTFLKRLNSKNPNIDFRVFIENLKTLIIEEVDNLDTKALAEYIPKENKILIVKNNINTIFHELLHCASCKKNEHVFVGFAQNYKDSGLAIGFTEGYTQILVDRYFNEYSSNSYNIEKLLAICVEKIIGKELMENLYFNADLYSLVEELKKHSTEKDIVLFLKYLDFFTIHTKGLAKINNMKNKLKYMSEFLVISYSKKLNTQIIKKEITRKEWKQNFLDFIKILNTSFENQNEKYDLLPLKSVKKIVKKYYLVLKQEKKK